VYSAPTNRLDVEHVKQPSPVSERSVVLLGVTPCVHVERTEGNRGDRDAIETVVTWLRPLTRRSCEKTRQRGLRSTGRTEMSNLLRQRKKSGLNRPREEAGSSVPQDR